MLIEVVKPGLKKILKPNPKPNLCRDRTMMIDYGDEKSVFDELQLKFK